MKCLKLYRVVGPSAYLPGKSTINTAPVLLILLPAHSGDSPVKNWGGVGVVDYPDRQGIHHDVFATRVDKGHACYRCALACKAVLKAGEGEYNTQQAAADRNTKTAAAFGPNIANGHTDSITWLMIFATGPVSTLFPAARSSRLPPNCMKTELLLKQTRMESTLMGEPPGNRCYDRKKWPKRRPRRYSGGRREKSRGKNRQRLEQYAIHIGGQEVAFHDPKAAQHRAAVVYCARYLDDTPDGTSSLFGR